MLLLTQSDNPACDITTLKQPRPKNRGSHNLVMIRCVVVVNNHGKARLTHFYERMGTKTEQQVVREIFNVVSKRSDTICNFLEGGELDFMFCLFVARIVRILWHFMIPHSYGES